MAAIVILFIPSVKKIVIANEPFETDTLCPLTVNVTAVESEIVPETIMDERLVMVESIGDETAKEGGVRSAITVLETVVVLPAASVATIVNLFFPSVNTI